MRFIVIIGLLLLPASAGAAFQSVLLTATPEHPQPGASVVLTATVLGEDSKAIDFVWEVDGQVVSQGSNMSSLSIAAPNAGDSSEVVVSIFKGGKSLGSALRVIRPAFVAIEWESLGSRPPFYIGRPLPSARGTITAVAVPILQRESGSVVSAADTLFTWRVDGKVQSRASGYGRTTIRVAPTFFNEPYLLSVSAESRDGQLKAERGTLIRQLDPSIVVYEVSPLAGLRDERAVVGSYTFAHDEVSFKAYPLNAEDPASLSVQWELGGETLVLETGDPFLAVFRKTGAGSGSYEVGFSFSHVGDFLRRASTSFLLTF